MLQSLLAMRGTVGTDFTKGSGSPSTFVSRQKKNLTGVSHTALTISESPILYSSSPSSWPVGLLNPQLQEPCSLLAVCACHVTCHDHVSSDQRARVGSHVTLRVSLNALTRGHDQSPHQVTEGRGAWGGGGGRQLT